MNTNDTQSTAPIPSFATKADISAFLSEVLVNVRSRILTARNAEVVSLSHLALQIINTLYELEELE